MDKTLGLSIVVGAALGKSYFSTFKNAEQKVGKLGDALKKTGAQQAMLTRFGKLKKSVADTDKEMQSAQDKVAVLAKEIKATDKPSKTLINNFNRAKKSASRLKDAHRKQAETLHKLRGELRSAGIDTRKMVGEQKKLGRAYDETRRKMERLSRAQKAKSLAADKLGGMRGKALGFVGAAYGASRLAGLAMDREEQATYLKTVINARDGNKNAAIGRALQHARQFSRGSLASDGEVLQIEYALNSAGLSEDVSRAGSELVHKLAKITKGSSEQVGEIVGVTFNNMGNSMVGSAQEKMTQIGNILAKTQFKYQIRDFGQLGESMKYAAATASSAKIPLAQTAAIIGQLNSAGLQGSMAGTAFAGVMRNMTKASEELGFEIVRDKDGMLDVGATLEGLADAVDGMEIDQKSDIFQKLFGDEGKRAIVPLLEKLPELKSGIKELQKVANGDLVADTYKDFLKTSRGQWTTFKQNIIQVGGVFAGTLLPVLNTVLSPLANLMGWVASGIEAFPVIGWAIGGVAAGFAIYATGLAVATAAQWAFNAALLANPVGLAIATFIVGATLIYTAWEPVTKWFGEKMDWLAEKFSFISDAWHTIFGDGDKTITQRVKQTVEPIKKTAIAASVAATMAAVPAHAVNNTSSPVIHNSYQITAPQQPGQDGAKHAEEIMREIERAEAAKSRSAMNNRESDL